MNQLKEVYQAPTEKAALLNLDTPEENRGNKYSLAIRSWRNNMANLSTFFKYPQEIRTVIYTINAFEAVHHQFRKVTKAKSLFPNDDADEVKFRFTLQQLQFVQFQKSLNIFQ